jgi:ABC-type branched-subunit amino acid transport system ATPase component
LVGLDEVSLVKAGDLSHKDQRILQITLALASHPRLILLDEPVAGMNPEEVKTTMDLIRKIGELGVTILLIEHNMKAIMDYCETVIVLDYGRKIAEGVPKKVRLDENVIRAYLGTSTGYS